MAPMLDTNILFDLFTDNNNSILAKALVREPIYIFKGVFYELATLLKVRIGTKLTNQILTKILEDSQNFMITDADSSDSIQALKILDKYHMGDRQKDMTIVDALQLVLATNLRLTLYTTDERMTHLDQKLAKIIKPY